jgi:Domain of unknown function (DUF4192)
MTSLRTVAAAAAHLSVRGPADLLQTVPYLLGFRPEQSLVLVGLSAGQVAVTVRIDLLGLGSDDTLHGAIAAMRDGGAGELVAALFADGSAPSPSGALPWQDVLADVMDEAVLAGCTVMDVLLVADGRFWSYLCANTACCPPEGRPLPEDTTAVVAAATYAGMVALPDRASLAALLDPQPDAERAHLGAAVAAAEHEQVQAILEGRGQRHDRSVKRAIFAAARAADQPGADASDITPAQAARFGAALSRYPIRDAVWMAVDDGRIDGRELWRTLAVRLPSPYDAAPLFLFGWASWRAGNGALAGVAAERAVASDPGYSAADLLLAALSRGIDPRRLPRLRARGPG